MLFQRLGLPTLLLLSSIPVAQALTLEEYLTEVRERNGNFRGLNISVKAKESRKDEATLFFKPSFFLTGEYSDDQRPTLAPAFQGQQTMRHTLRAGLSQNFRTGTKAAISYNYYQTKINGTEGGLVRTPKFFDVAPMLEVTQSLWRNFLGKEFEANEEVQLAQVEAQRLNDMFTYKQLNMQAENAYWRLYFAQTTLRVQEESLARARKLRDWNKGRFSSNLIDESDLIQSEANLQNREIEYQDTLSDINAAQKEFNSLRQMEGDVNLEGTKGRSSAYILDATLPSKMKMREDVRAALANTKAAQANSQLGVERNRPTLELYGQYSINGRDKFYSEATDQAFGATRPYSIVGVRFSAPLDFGAQSDYRKAYAQESKAAEMTYQRRLYEVDRNYEILSQRFEDFKKRLKLAIKFVEVQDKKYKTEQRRYQQGRTTTFQVVQFEQDLANTELIRLRYERDLILVYNELKLFSGEEYE
ncbi:TolC family protein [Peredibacter sp. HCB2-198]|uniref:TolC family protein n=1 Tax=Peredibacter sp. HCB2-198 TaxID=3383025 RepID=UPI0038B5D9EB